MMHWWNGLARTSFTRTSFTRTSVARTYLARTYLARTYLARTCHSCTCASCTFIGVLLAQPSALAQTVTPAPAAEPLIPDWIWMAAIVIVVAFALWYFLRTRRG